MNRRIHETGVLVNIHWERKYLERDGKRYARHDRPLVSVHQDVTINRGIRHDRGSRKRHTRGGREPVDEFSAPAS